MGVEIPDLDDEEFEDIFERAKRQIPIHTSEWTDHNVHDTGVAILELLAWVSETYIYQINHLSDRERRKYLNLLGVRQRPPQPATGQVTLEPPTDADGTIISAGTELSVDDSSGVLKSFVTDSATTLTAANLERVITCADGDTVDNTRENETRNTNYYMFGDDPASGDTLYLGFDRDPFADASVLELTFDLYDDQLPEIATHGEFDSTFEPSVEVNWQYCPDYNDWENDDAWADVPVVEDQTNVFYQDGKVILSKPLDWEIDTDALNTVNVHNQRPGLVWLRCQVQTPGYEVPPQLDAIRLNILEVSHRQILNGELLKRADEQLETSIYANETFFFEHAPVLDATIEIDGEQWTAVDNLDTSGPTDTHYVLEKQRGAVVFGDGINGAKPPVGKHVLATRYVHGGGTAGNVSDAADWYFDDEQGDLIDGVSLADVPVSPIGPATGGTDMESIPEAIDRFKRDLKVPYRAATLDDYEYIATHTPGLRFGRAKAMVTTEQTPQGDTLNKNHVVVVPYSMKPKPEPSDGFLDAVREHLDRCSLIGDHVSVGKPEYVRIGITVTVSALPSYSRAEVIREITDELREYLHPITGYDGDGWPFGRPLYVTEIEDIIATISCISRVETLSISANGEEDIDEYGNVLIPDTALLSLVEDDITATVTFE